MLPNVTTRERGEEAAGLVRAMSPLRPLVGIILGSGLGSVSDRVVVQVRVRTSSLPGFPRSTVAGHAGELLLGTWHNTPVAVLSGRVHLYEGYSPAQVAFPVRFLHALGCRYLIVTNAAGALNERFNPGDIVLIEDHISFPSLSGHSPLRGASADPDLSPFVDLTNAYSPELRTLAEHAANQASVPVRRGVYVMVGGPNFETPAEVRFLRAAGGDLVGMSTVPEVIVARQLHLAVLGLSVVSNLAAGLPAARLDHHDVLATVRQAAPSVGLILDGVLAGLAAW